MHNAMADPIHRREWIRDFLALAAYQSPNRDAKWFHRYCPARQVDSRYPPTMLVHGTNDTDVPYEQSVQMQRELARAGVKHELVTVEGAGHGLGRSDPALVRNTYAKAVAFVKQHLS